MGVQILNKDVSIISSIVGRAKATIGNVGGITGWAGGGGFQPGDFNFNNVSYSWTVGGSTNTVTFTKSGTLYISAPLSINNDINMFCNFSKNSPATLGFWAFQADAITNTDSYFGDSTPLRDNANFYAVCNVVVGNTMSFNFTAEFGGPDLGSTITVRVDSFSGTIIDTFTVQQT